MRNIFKEVTLREDQESYLDTYRVSLFMLMAPALIGGAYMQSAVDAEGHHIFPQILRHHLTNFADPFGVTPIIARMDFFRNFGPIKKTLCEAFGAVAAGVTFEVVQSLDFLRDFDFGDCTAYALGGALYAALMIREIYKMARANAPAPTPSPGN